MKPLVTSSGRKYAPEERYNPDIDTLKPKLDDDLAWDIRNFNLIWARNQHRYEAVAGKADIPANLIAAIHYREASGDFKKYLHQGDPLGKKAVHIPKYPECPLFNEWEPAAVHALKMKDDVRLALRITKNTTRLYQLCQFAETYNGLGYFYKGKPSPYVLNGTTGYEKGKYVADGVYDEKVKDVEIGVLPLLWASSSIRIADLVRLHD